MNNKNNKELMQTFSLLMGELMANEPIKKTEKHNVKRTGTTAVIETPFTDEDDIEREMTAEFWLGIMKHYLLEVECVLLRNPSREEADIYELQSIIEDSHVFKEEERICIRGKMSDVLRKYLMESSRQENEKVKWEQTVLIIENVEKVSLNKYGNECVIKDLTEEDFEIIETITSDFFSVAYY